MTRSRASITARRAALAAGLALFVGGAPASAGAGAGALAEPALAAAAALPEPPEPNDSLPTAGDLSAGPVAGHLASLVDVDVYTLAVAATRNSVRITVRDVVAEDGRDPADGCGGLTAELVDPESALGAASRETTVAPGGRSSVKTRFEPAADLAGSAALASELPPRFAVVTVRASGGKGCTSKLGYTLAASSTKAVGPLVLPVAAAVPIVAVGGPEPATAAPAYQGAASWFGRFAKARSVAEVPLGQVPAGTRVSVKVIPTTLACRRPASRTPERTVTLEVEGEAPGFYDNSGLASEGGSDSMAEAGVLDGDLQNGYGLPTGSVETEWMASSFGTATISGYVSSSGPMTVRLQASARCGGDGFWLWVRLDEGQYGVQCRLLRVSHKLAPTLRARVRTAKARVKAAKGKAAVRRAQVRSRAARDAREANENDIELYERTCAQSWPTVGYVPPASGPAIVVPAAVAPGPMPPMPIGSPASAGAAAG